jgi:hypothetical protein
MILRFQNAANVSTYQTFHTDFAPTVEREWTAKGEMTMREHDVGTSLTREAQRNDK